MTVTSGNNSIVHFMMDRIESLTCFLLSKKANRGVRYIWKLHSPEREEIYEKEQKEENVNKEEREQG